jgi:hypothetical protein
MMPAAPDDLYAEVRQPACDKILDSVTYPFTAFEQSWPFPGCDQVAIAAGEADPPPFHAYTKGEIQQILNEAIQRPKGEGRQTPYDHIFSFCGSIIEQAKKVVDAAKDAGQKYKGPDPKLMQAIVDGGIKQLPQTLKPFGDWGWYAWCSYLRLIVKSRPYFKLGSPRTDLKKLDLRGTATGEIWIKYPWWNCYHWCFEWDKVIKCDRILSVTPTVDVKADAYANCAANGATVYLRGAFDKLVLDYPILDQINLAGIANLALRSKLVYVYDASQMIETIPILKSRFTVDKISLPNSASGIDVSVTIRKLP